MRMKGKVAASMDSNKLAFPSNLQARQSRAGQSDGKRRLTQDLAFRVNCAIKQLVGEMPMKEIRPIDSLSPRSRTPKFPPVQ